MLSFRKKSTDNIGCSVYLSATLSVNGCKGKFLAVSNGLLEAYVCVMEQAIGTKVRLLDYHEHALTPGVKAHAAAYTEIEGTTEMESVFGIGFHSDMATASLEAVTAAVNHALEISVLVQSSVQSRNTESKDTVSI